MSSRRLASRLEKLEAELSDSGKEKAVKAEVAWWHALIMNLPKLPPRPKTRHITLEMIVAEDATLPETHQKGDAA